MHFPLNIRKHQKDHLERDPEGSKMNKVSPQSHIPNFFL